MSMMDSNCYYTHDSLFEIFQIMGSHLYAGPNPFRILKIISVRQQCMFVSENPNHNSQAPVFDNLTVLLKNLFHDHDIHKTTI